MPVRERAPIRDRAKRTGDLRFYSEIYSALDNKRPDVAVRVMRSAADAEHRAAEESKQPAPDHLQELEGWATALESGDKDAINTIKGNALFQIALATGLDKFSSTYGTVLKGND